MPDREAGQPVKSVSDPGAGGVAGGAVCPKQLLVVSRVRMAGNILSRRPGKNPIFEVMGASQVVIDSSERERLILSGRM